MSWEAWVAPLPYLLALLLVPRVIHERRPSGATVAWLLAIGLFPALGVPLYLLLGGRTIRRRIRARTGREEIAPPSPPPLEAELGPVASRCSETLVRVGAPPPVPGPGVRFFEDGVSAYAGLMEAFDRARHHIHVQTFILGRDPTGRAVVRRLAERAAEGVRVRLLVDGFGAFPFFYRFTAPLARAGGEARIFHPTFPVWRAVTANLRNHRKIVVVDGELAVVGGMNLKDEYMAPEPLPDQWIDYNMSLEGPGVGHLQALFLEDWRDAGGRPPEPDEPLFPRPSPHADGAESSLQVVPSGPDLPRRPIHYGVLAALTAAQGRVVIVTPYFVPDDVTAGALRLALARGCRVQLLLPERSNHRLADWAGRAYLDELLEMGCEVFLTPRMVHAKMMLVDEALAVVGSANMDGRSFLLNFEIDLFLYGPREVARARAYAERLLNTAACLDPEAFRRRGAVRRFGEDVCRLFSPLL